MGVYNDSIIIDVTILLNERFRKMQHCTKCVILVLQVVLLFCESFINIQMQSSNMVQKVADNIIISLQKTNFKQMNISWLTQH